MRWSWIVVGAVAVAAAYVFLVDETHSIDTSIVEKTIGKLVPLSHGKSVHYVLRGPENGPLVVLVHGIFSSQGMLKWLAEYLAEEGFRVLTYDLYGRGLSDHVPNAIHDASLYTTQLHELLTHLNLNHATFDLLGVSMGGAIAAHYAAENLDSIRRLVLIAPAGMNPDLPLMAKLATLPYVGELLSFSALGRRAAINQARGGSAALQKYPEQYNYLRTQSHYHVFKKEGFAETVLSCLRQFPFTNSTGAFRTIGEKGKFPVKIIWGTADTTCPYNGAQQAISLIPHALLFSVTNGTHGILYEEHEVVHPEVLSFFKS